MKAHLSSAIIVAWLSTSALAHAQPSGSSVAVRYDASAEVASAVYQMSTVVEALKVEYSAEIRDKDSRIRQLEGQLRTAQAGSSEAKRLGDELSRLQREVVDQLAEKDAELSRQVAAFRSAVEDIATTPEGVAILARRKPGNLRQARELLIDLEARMAAAEQKAVDVRSAARVRSIATIALDDRNKGEASTQEVISLFEKVVALDGIHWDWISLGRLQMSSGNLVLAEESARKAAIMATTDRDRIVAHIAIGDALMQRGSLPQARIAYQDGLTIAERVGAGSSDVLAQLDHSVALEKLGDALKEQRFLDEAHAAYHASMAIFAKLLDRYPTSSTLQNAASISLIKVGDVLRAQRRFEDALKAYAQSRVLQAHLVKEEPNNIEWLKTLSLVLERIGNIQRSHLQSTEALASYREALRIDRQIAEADPSNKLFQRGVSVSLDKIGDVLFDQGDLQGALSSYRESLIITKSLADADLYNATWQRDLSLCYGRVGKVLGAQGNTQGAVEAFHDRIAVTQRLLSSNSTNAQWQRDLVVANIQLGDVSGERAYFLAALELARTLAVRDELAPPPEDQAIIDELIEKAGLK